METLSPKSYAELARKTTSFDWEDKDQRMIAPLGLLGECGSLASVIKRRLRDGEAYVGFTSHLIEELGDVLWYTIALADYRNVHIPSWPDERQSLSTTSEKIFEVERTALELTTDLFTNRNEKKNADLELLTTTLLSLLASIAKTYSLSFHRVIDASITKISGYWLSEPNRPATIYDSDFPEYEQLPRRFTIDFLEINRSAGQREAIMSLNGIHLGDRLTDNSHNDDGYRFHDIFHFAAATCLGWSPVFRRLLKKKRKSVPRIDEVEDGARAAILEEAILGQIFAYARDNNFLKNIERVDLDLIKMIQRLVRGYEVEATQPWEWQDFILKSFKIFNEVRGGFTGQIHFDADARNIQILK